jgi:hypothetical protein
MQIFVLYSILSAALYYLGSRAVITRALWSRYPAWLAHFMDCSACSAFWYGIAISVTIGRRYGLSYLGLDPYDLFTPLLVGLGCLTITPIVGGFMQAGFEQLGSAVGGGNGSE